MQFRNGNLGGAGKKLWLMLPALALCLFCLKPELHAETGQAKTSSANLHISVVVMPVLEAARLTPNLSSWQSSGAVTYQLQKPAQEQTPDQKYEVRPFPGAIAGQNQHAPAVLKTLVVVPQ